MDCIVYGVAKSWTWLRSFHFQFSVIFKISLETSFLSHGLLEMFCFISKFLKIFLLSFRYWFLVWLHHSKKTTLWFHLLILLRFVLWSRICSILVYMFHENLKGMYILLLLGGVFYKYWLMVVLHSFISLPIFCPAVHWLLRGMLTSPTISVDLSISLFSSLSFLFTYLAVLWFGAYIFWIAMPFLVNGHFYHVMSFFVFSLL